MTLFLLRFAQLREVTPDGIIRHVSDINQKIRGREHSENSFNESNEGVLAVVRYGDSGNYFSRYL
ncbi:hypothetical protein D3C85_1211350 [compost metagenome]